MVKTLCSHCRGHRFDLWSGNLNPTCHMLQPKKKKTIITKQTKKKTWEKFYLNKIVLKKNKTLHMYRLNEEKQVIPRFK